MATSKEYRDFVLEQLTGLDKITCRSMMGGYLLYYDNILFGGLYDDRLLVKKVSHNEKYKLGEELPYKGAKMMYLIDDIENKERLAQIILDTCVDLPRKK